MKFKRTTLAAFVLSSFFTTSVHAAAFQLYELGTPIIGMAGVGQAVDVDDASISYFNPAAMTELHSNNFMLGSQLILPYTNFSANNQTTIPGNNGGNAGGLTPGLDLYYVYHYSPQLRFGVSFTSPYGGMLNYNDGWVGRYVVQYMQFYTLNLNPSVAYEVNNWVSIGGGLAIEYANLNQTVAIPITSLVDGQANLKVNNTAGGFNLGVFLKPRSGTKIGLAYRSKITHNLTGSTTFLRISATPDTSTKMVMPQNVILSLSQTLTNRINLLGEVGWSNWSTMRNSILHINQYSIVTPQNWNDTYRVGIAGQFNAMPNLILQTGVSFDSSPTTTSKRLPDLPMDRQIRAGLGVQYSMIKAVKLGFAYEYINFGNAAISTSGSTGVLSGDYSRNYANVFQASVNVSC